MEAELKRKRSRKIATVVVVGGMLCIFLFDIAAVLLGNYHNTRWPVSPEPFEARGATRIHFLNTENSDCILLESEGHFALIDAGWGSDNPIEASRRPGTEQRVIEYLKRVAADDTGNVVLDFILPTHYHYDHAGGFAAILSDPAIQVNTVFLRPLHGRNHDYELESWDIGAIRQSIADAAEARGFYLEENIPEEASFGAFSLQFLNTGSMDNPRLKGENDNTIVVLAEYAGVRALLTGDISAPHGLERDIARQVGQVDLLKLPHHGYALSSSAAFLRAVQPKLAVVTNGIGKIYPNVRWNLAFCTKAGVLSSVSENGIIVTISPDSQMLVTTDLHLEALVE